LYNIFMEPQGDTHSIFEHRTVRPSLLSSDLLSDGANGQLSLDSASRRFSGYHLRRAGQTLRRQQADLALFEAFLGQHSLPCGDLFAGDESWRQVTWQQVETFLQWQLGEGYAVPTVNVRLSTIKAYARLALQSGLMTPEEYALVRAVQGFTPREQRRIDQKRPVVRIGAKKDAPVALTTQQASALKSQPGDKPQGRRDALLMCLLLDHGLRAGELSALTVEALDLEKGLLRFFRSKVGKEQVHRLSPDALDAARAYAAFGDMGAEGPLMRRSLKSEKLGEAGLTTRAISQRVNLLGKALGIAHLSAHDCRHYWATAAARGGTDPFRLQEAGGWSSLAMPRRYIAENEIANDGVVLK